MRALIVGPGYIGLALGKELVRLGHDVFGLRRSADTLGVLTNEGISPLIGDITQPDSLTGLPTRFDWVVSCVSSTHGDADDYRRVYLQGAQNLVNWLSSTPPAIFVYTSSTGVYGQNDGSLIDETSPIAPPTDTGRILAETERVYLDAARSGRMPSIILRVAGIYGPSRSWWLNQCMAGEARIEGEGRRHLNMIHREDVVGCIIAALHRGRPGEIYNAVDDEPVQQREFLEWLARKLNHPTPPSIPESMAINRKRGVSDKRISNRKLKDALRYAFRYPSFREGYASLLE